MTRDYDHCQQCGRRADSPANAEDGYTLCCNERVVWGGRPCDTDDCSHGA